MTLSFFAYNTDCDAYILRFASDAAPPRHQPYSTLTDSEHAGTTEDPRMIVVCPGSPFWGTTVSIVPAFGLDHTGTGNTTVTLETRKLPSARVPAPACTDFQGTHTCINSNQEFMFTGLVSKTLLRFVVPLEQNCGTLMWTSDSSFVKISFTDPWLWPTNSSDAIQTRQLEDQERPGLFGYCFNDTTQHYVYGWIVAETNTTIFFDSNNEWVDLRPVSEIIPYDIPDFLQGAATVKCGNKSFTHWKGAAGDVSSLQDGFANIRFVWPQEDPHPFFPSPPFGTSWQWQGFITAPNSTITRPGRFALAVLLSQRLDPVEPLNPSLPNHQFLTTEEFESCTISFNGLITDSNGPIRYTIDTFEDSILSCDPEAFQAVSDQIGTLLELSGNEPQNALVQALYGYQMDLLVASRAWYACEHSLKDLYTVKNNSKVGVTNKCTAQFGTTAFDSDPCCHIPIRTPEYSACIATSKEIPQTEIELSNSAIQSRYASTPQCAAQSLQILNAVHNRQTDPTIQCEYTDRRAFDQLQSTAWYSCFYKFFGYSAPFAGTPCNHDSECEGTNLCVASSKTCTLNQTKQSLGFLECIISNFRSLDPYVLLTTCNRLGVNCTDAQDRPVDVIAFDMFTALDVPAAPNTCSVDFWFNFESSYNRVNPTAIWTTTRSCIGTTCFLNVKWSFSTDENSMTWDCLHPSCSLINVAVANGPITDTCGAPICNVNSFQFRPFCPVDQMPPFCGICDDGGGATCRSLGVSPSCITDWCILPNNTLAPVDNQTCTSIMGCTANISGSSPTECTSSGICSDSTDPVYAIFAPPYDLTYGITGACLVEIRLRDEFRLGQEICPFPFRTTILGCLFYFVSPAQCTDPNYVWPFDPRFYRVQGKRYYPRAQTQAQCEAYGEKCVGTPRANKIRSTFSDVTINATSCDPPFVLKKIFEWTPGKWLPGQPRKVSPQPIPVSFSRASLLSFHAGTPPIFSARQLFTILQQQASNHFSLIIRSESFCRVAQKRSVLDDLFCTKEPCYPPTQGFVTTQLGVACSQDLNPIKAYPVTIISSNNSLPSGVCQILEFATQSIVRFQDNQAVQLSNALLSPMDDSAWTVRNQNAAIIGKAVTDGVSVRSEIELVNVQLCLPLSQRRIGFQDSNFPVMDIAVEESGTHNLVPLAKTVTFSNNTFCASNVDLGTNLTFYFIIRTEGTPQQIQDLQRSSWTPNELAYISVILALYCIGLIGAIFGCVQGFFRKSFVETHLIFVLLIMFFIFRVVLFALAIGKPYSLAQEVVGYLLVEFPLILFFAFVSLFIITWSIVIRSSKVLANSSGDFWIKLARFLAVLFIFTVFTIFILLIILFNTLVDAPSLICRDTVILYDSDTAFAMVMAYRAMFSTFAFILGTVLAIIGFLILRIIRDPSLSIPISTQIKVVCATVFGSFGLFAQAIYYLVITATRGYRQSTYLSLSILLIDEVIPSLLFLACIVTLPNPGTVFSSLGRRSTSKGSHPGQKTSSKNSSKSSGKMSAGGVVD